MRGVNALVVRQALFGEPADVLGEHTLASVTADNDEHIVLYAVASTTSAMSRDRAFWRPTTAAIAPGATIDVVLSGPRMNLPANLGAGLRAAVGRGNVVSDSYDGCPNCLDAHRQRSLDRALRFARDRHVTVIAATR